jgi:hypothetical protein
MSVVAGLVKNGVVVPEAPLPEGAEVEIRLRETAALDDGFWQGVTFDQQAAAQGITKPCSFDDLLGGWPEDEMDDHFEEAVAQWRKEDTRRGDL